MRREDQRNKTLAVETIQEIPPAAKQGYENINLERDSDQRMHKEISEQNSKAINEAMSMLQRQQGEAHQRAVLQWNLKR